MPVTLKGVKINSINIKRDEESGRAEVEAANYSLISSTDHVLATQAIGGYGGLKINASNETVKALEAFIQSYKTDVLTTLGLGE